MANNYFFIDGRSPVRVQRAVGLLNPFREARERGVSGLLPTVSRYPLDLGLVANEQLCDKISAFRADGRNPIGPSFIKSACAFAVAGPLVGIAIAIIFLG